MNLKVNLDYKLPKENKEDNRQITANYIQMVFNQKYKDGIKGQLYRTLGRIQRKLDEAIDDKKDFIELESSEMDLLKKAFNENEILVPPQLAKYFMILEDAVEALKKVETVDNKK